MYRAKLDLDGVYWGVEEVAELGPGDIEVPADCDLRPGAYRWEQPDGVVHQAAHFQPLPNGQVKKEPGGPTLDQAFYDLVQQAGLREGSPRLKAWCEVFEASIEGEPT